MAEELYKQPSESRLYHFVFTSLLESAETLATIVSVTQVNLGNVNGSGDLTIASQTLSTDRLQVRLLDGTTLESYKLTAIVTTDNSNTLELDGILHVRDL